MLIITFNSKLSINCRYYSVVRKPMDLSKMEEKLENGSYKSLNQFKKDFRLIVDNCRQYNGSENGKGYFIQSTGIFQQTNVALFIIFM